MCNTRQGVQAVEPSKNLHTLLAWQIPRYRNPGAVSAPNPDGMRVLIEGCDQHAENILSGLGELCRALLYVDQHAASEYLPSYAERF